MSLLVKEALASPCDCAVLGSQGLQGSLTGDKQDLE